MQQANDAKVVPGWTIKVRGLDDSSDPAKGARAAKKLATDPTVVAVVGPYNSGVAEMALPPLAQEGIALVSPSNTLTSLTLGDDPGDPRRPYESYFRMVGHDSLQAAYLAERARDLGFANAAVVSETKAVSKGLADEFDAEFAALGGTTSVRKTVPDGATAEQFAEFLTIAAPARPDFVFFGGEYNVAAVLRAAAFERGLIVPLMGGDGMNDPEYMSGAGFASGDSYASGVGVPLEALAGADEFRAAYRGGGQHVGAHRLRTVRLRRRQLGDRRARRTARGQEVAPVERARAVVSRPAGNGPAGLTGQVGFDEFGDPLDPRLHALPRRRLAAELDSPPGRLSRTRRRARAGLPETRSRLPRVGGAVDRVAVDVDDHTAPVLVVAALELVHALPVRPQRVPQRARWSNKKMFGTSFQAAIQIAFWRLHHRDVADRGKVEDARAQAAVEPCEIPAVVATPTPSRSRSQHRPRARPPRGYASMSK